MLEIFKKGLNPREVIDEYSVKKTRKRTLRQKFSHFVFKKEDIIEIEGKIADKEKYVVDSSIIENVKRKIRKIRKIQGEQFAMIKGEDAT